MMPKLESTQRSHWPLTEEFLESNPFAFFVIKFNEFIANLLWKKSIKSNVV